MKKSIVPKDEEVMSKIHFIRNLKVMLDKDLADLYGINPRRLREQVKRNKARFPRNFMFQLTARETDAMVSQNATPSKQQMGGSRPFAFTEHGVLMLSNVLKSKSAIKVSLRVIEIFVKIREVLSVHKDIMLKLEQLEKRTGKHDQDIQAIFSALKNLISTPRESRIRIGYRRSNETN